MLQSNVQEGIISNIVRVQCATNVVEQLFLFVAYHVSICAKRDPYFVSKVFVILLLSYHIIHDKWTH